MNTKSPKVPTPDDLLAEVRGFDAPKTYQFEDYMEVIHELHLKEFSYAKISEFLAGRLKIDVNRGQVYRAYQLWLAKQQEDEGAEQYEDDFEPPQTFQDEIDERTRERALDLIDTLTQEDVHNDPCDDPHSIISVANEILDQRAKEAREADEAAAEADREIDAKKGGSGAPAK